MPTLRCLASRSALLIIKSRIEGDEHVPTIPYLLIRGVDPQTYNRVRKLAAAQRKSISDTARNLLSQHLKVESFRSARDAKTAPARKAKVKVRRI